jgi:hypothetical protein
MKAMRGMPLRVRSMEGLGIFGHRENYGYWNCNEQDGDAKAATARACAI